MAGAQVRYEVEVSGPGEASVGGEESTAGDIVLEVRYFDDVAKASEVARGDVKDPAGLEAIKGSDCFNCHAFSSRLSGPSFREISKRYVGDAGGAATLSLRVREGSSGKWGKAVMPAHPQLSEEQASAIVAWILETGSDVTRNYYVGAEGSFRVDVPPQVPQGRGGALMLTATYAAVADRAVLPVSTASAGK